MGLISENSSQARSAVAHGGEGHDGPDGGVGVLAAVFAHAGDIAFDVAGIEVRLVERRIEQLDQAGRRGGRGGDRRSPWPCIDALVRAGAGENRPALRDANRSGIPRWSPSRAACRRRSRRGDTTRRPSRALRCCRAAGRLRPCSDPRVPTSPRRRASSANCVSTSKQEERQPDALALAVLADEVHAVVPVAAAHQRQAVLAEAQAVVDRADAVLVERADVVGDLRQVVVRFFVGPQRPRRQERHALVEHAGVARRARHSGKWRRGSQR